MKNFNTKRDEVGEVILNIPVSDPYRWLEDGEDPEVKTWVDSQNTYVEEELRGDFFNTFQKELTSSFLGTDFLVPVPGQGRFFYREKKQDEQQYVLYTKENSEREPVCIVNPNELSSDGAMILSSWTESVSSSYVAYELSEKGSEMGTIYIKNVNTGEVLAEHLERCRYSSIAWLPNDSGFYYTRHPYPGEVPQNEEHLHQKVYFHMLGTKQENDILVFGQGRPLDDMISLKLSPDGQQLVISVACGWIENEIYIYHTVNKTTSLFLGKMKAKFSLSFSREKVFLLTNYNADKKRVLSAPIELWNSTPVEEWAEFIPENEYVLDSISISKSKILAHYLVNVCSEVRVYGYDGVIESVLPLPSFSAIHSIHARYYNEDFFYGIRSFLIPFVIYKYNPDTKRIDEYKSSENPIRPEDYVVLQEWCVSKDGTNIPFFIVQKKDAKKNSKNPLILCGYGAHGTSLRPSFWKNFSPWLAHGGIFVVANIRGGGEFGKKWQEEGSGLTKQNSFDDFIAVAEHLVAQKYTNPQHLGISGGSMGGTLVTAVSVQRPDLFKAVCAEVGILDIVRFHLFGLAVRWTGELGDPRDETGLKAILSWSPYHNMKEGKEYPAYFFTTGENDTRVNPLHSRKMTALAQWVNKINKVFLRTEVDAGHGAGKSTEKIVESSAYKLSFFAKELGLNK